MSDDQDVRFVKTILLKNQNGVLQRCEIGFSWTFLFFGWMVPTIRRDYPSASLFLILNVGLALLLANLDLKSHAAIIDKLFSGPNFWLLWIQVTVAFFYNKIYIRYMINKNYVPASRQDEEKLEKLFEVHKEL
ncbi:MAG: hypothetical protein LBL99_02815 [Holosporaceae bacterium]|jgi:hypothetical protein|nr:hypothetical protein [Holosporaceae bacterium]